MPNKKKKKTSTRIPLDKKTTIPPKKTRQRIAMLEGACGQAGRAMLCGQVVDMLVDINQAKTIWTPFKQATTDNTTKLATPKLRAIDDILMLSVRRARLKWEFLKITPEDFELEKADSYPVLHSSKEFHGGENGFFAQTIPEEINSGSYVARITLLGIDSIRQSLQDLRYIADSNQKVLTNNIVIGYGSVEILPESSSQTLIICDIDQTLLNTRIDSTEGLFQTLNEEVQDKKFIMGMAPLLRHLQHGPQEKQDTNTENMLFFLSASPHFFRRTLTVLLQQHGLKTSAMYLKYLPTIIGNFTNKLKEITTHPLEAISMHDWRTTLEKSAKFISTNILTLVDQIHYKLEMLLRNRLMQASKCKEILIGDNTESDFFIFILYQLLLITPQKKQDIAILNELHYKAREAFSTEGATTIYQLVKENQKLHGNINPVQAVWINQSEKGYTAKELQDLTQSALPLKLWDNYNLETTIIKPRLCAQGAGMSLAAFEEGIIEKNTLDAIEKEIKLESV